MNYKKGLSTIQTVVIVIVVLLAIFLAYKIGTNKSTNQNTQNSTTQESATQNTGQTNNTSSGTQNTGTSNGSSVSVSGGIVSPSTETATCKMNTPASITVLSPNGGESYKAGQKITVKWKSCNLPSTTKLSIDIVPSSAVLSQWSLQHACCGVFTNSATNTGSGIFDLPTVNNFQGGALMYGKYYKIKVTEQTAQNGIQLSDVSDGMFSITGISIALPTPYISVQGTWPPVIQSYYNGYSCNKVHSDMIDTASRVINGTTYCVTDLHEASAGTIHHTFTYVTRAYSGTGTKTTNFTLNYQSCDLSQTDCKTAQANFNLDAIIDTLMNQ